MKSFNSFGAGINFRQNLNLSESDIYRRQILKSKVDPRAVRGKYLIIIIRKNCISRK